MEREREGGVDIGRVAVLPVIAVFGGLAVLSLWSQFTEPATSAGVQVAALIRGGLLVVFYGLVVGFYLARTAARSGTGSWLARCSAVVATFLPLPLG
ncbi:MAG: hypothetical protein ACRDZW_05375, partial [Acidimicrobiales bacterium]